MGKELTDQGASRFGALLFELQTAGGRVCTHAGVLEFTAPEGTVMLPPKVRQQQADSCYTQVYQTEL